MKKRWKKEHKIHIQYTRCLHMTEDDHKLNFIFFWATIFLFFLAHFTLPHIFVCMWQMLMIAWKKNPNNVLLCCGQGKIFKLTLDWLNIQFLIYPKNHQRKEKFLRSGRRWMFCELYQIELISLGLKKFKRIFLKGKSWKVLIIMQRKKVRIISFCVSHEK